MSRIIFLDIDGVLNANFQNDACQGEISEGTLVNREKIALLGELVRRTNARLVLHSGWRFWFDGQIKPATAEASRLADMLKAEGMEIHDVTPDMTTEEIRSTKKFSLVKAQEILGWVSMHNDTEGWVVLDDLDLHNDEVRRHQVKTDPAVGLTAEDIQRAETILLKQFKVGGKMRPEKEMMDLIVDIAAKDDRIRAVIMAGSRANPDAPRDCYQDYDIEYLVRDVGEFYDNTGWVEENFGKPVVSQRPYLNKHLFPSEEERRFTWLMIFPDGNRIDLTVEEEAGIGEGEPAVVLLDKDGILAGLQVRKDYFYVKRPEEGAFHECCNEFWWCLNNVGKGIARDEVPYTMHMFNVYVRDMLHLMTDWYIGVHCDFKVSPGKQGKWYKKYLPHKLYGMLLATYPSAGEKEMWDAVFVMCDLFHLMAVEVAERLGFTYHAEEERGMRGYLEAVKDKSL